MINSSYLSLWEGCLANKDIKPVGQYLQAAAAWTRRWLHMYVSNVQTCLMPRWRTLGCPHHRRPLQGVCRFIPSAFCSKAATPRVINKTSQCSRGHRQNYSARHAGAEAGSTSSLSILAARFILLQLRMVKSQRQMDGDWQVLLFSFWF